MNEYGSHLLPPAKESTRAACKKCGYAGHLTYQYVSSTSSETDQEYLTPLTELREKELVEKLKKKRKKKKKKTEKKVKRKRKHSSTESSSDSDSDYSDKHKKKHKHKKKKSKSKKKSKDSSDSSD